MMKIIQNKDAVQHKMVQDGVPPEVLDEDPGLCCGMG